MSTNGVSPISDEMLMAFADGELEGDEAARIERAIEASPELAARVEMFLATRLKAQAAFRSVLAEPVPERLLKAATGFQARPPASGTREGAQVLPFDQSTSRAAPARRWSGMAIAASLVGIMAAGALGFIVGREGEAPGNAMAGLFANEKSIAAFLGEARDGARRDVAKQLNVAVNATYRMGNQALCRTFDVAHEASATGAQALACYSAGGWKIAGALPTSPKDGLFRPASGGASVEALLDAGGAGEALPAAEVEALIGKGWR